MGFTSGLLGGFTLTSSILYLTIQMHAQKRAHQSALLRQQSLILENIIRPLPAAPPTTAREARVGVVESAKDRWNGEIERLVRRAQSTDWRLVGERLERGVEVLVGKLGDLGGEIRSPSVPQFLYYFWR
ncbi:hypothetical protein EJ08DRAFT_678062 [Tothia fuscella]|uniref:MICOS complex subunit MIC12 n=1 Tax=Tothia fuscella TaxID=1048955 RepID=A0A9P4NV05_9PEZI|nr:hypothetical protein EJ08DRAFT_678062 [Tothia fuscella]